MNSKVTGDESARALAGLSSPWAPDEPLSGHWHLGLKSWQHVMPWLAFHVTHHSPSVASTL